MGALRIWLTSLVSVLRRRGSPETARIVANFRLLLLSDLAFSTATTLVRRSRVSLHDHPQKLFYVERRDLELYTKLLALKDVDDFSERTATDVIPTTR